MKFILPHKQYFDFPLFTNSQNLVIFSYSCHSITGGCNQCRVFLCNLYSFFRMPAVGIFICESCLHWMININFMLWQYKYYATCHVNLFVILMHMLSYTIVILFVKGYINLIPSWWNQHYFKIIRPNTIIKNIQK